MTVNEKTYFELRSGGDFIRIDLINLIHPYAELEWDRNWIRSMVRVKAGDFSGEFKCDLRTTDFEKFKQGLSQLYDKLDGEASFDTIEGQVTIKIKGDGIGHLEADCCVRDDMRSGSKLEFTINFDQTIIPEMVRQLDDITRTFPVLGEL